VEVIGRRHRFLRKACWGIVAPEPRAKPYARRTGLERGIGAALTRLSRIRALVLMYTWCFTDYSGPSTIAKRRMTSAEKRAYHHVYDEAGAEAVATIWPRSIPLEEGNRHPGTGEVVL